jgi:hypothetical protein
MLRMMVLLKRRVECSAKIAMTPLIGAFGAIDLLPNYDLRGVIFLEVRIAQIRQS